MRFRPCIDLHGGRVKQIVGNTLTDDGDPATNFDTDKRAAEYARLYRNDGLVGGHVIMLGPGNDAAAREALENFPGGLQIGGGIGHSNAESWLEAGAAAVIVTSTIFVDGRLDRDRLESLADQVGPDRLVLDLSCREESGNYVAMANRWQTRTDVTIDKHTLRELSQYCSEFLIHAIDKEGQITGINGRLLALLTDIVPGQVTYAGGISSPSDLDTILRVGKGRVDFTVGSALDLFGGSGLLYRDLVRDWSVA
ncbi:MAG: phosphoribosylformimino-5-aminoimidazole carboxamide ribotide isomerase [Pseudomonadales bacterium]